MRLTYLFSLIDVESWFVVPCLVSSTKCAIEILSPRFRVLLEEFLSGGTVTSPLSNNSSSLLKKKKLRTIVDLRLITA